MITIPEGMGLEAFSLIENAEGIEGIRETIKGVRARKKWKYATTPASALKTARTPAEWDRFTRQGFVPASAVSIPEVEIKEKASRNQYARVREYADSIDQPQQHVRIVGFNRIAPVQSAVDIVPVSQRVADQTPVPVDEGEGVEIFPEEGDLFNARTERRNIPGIPTDAPEPQYMPEMIEIEAPDKLIYRGPRRSRPSEKIEEEAHEEVENAMGGIQRVPDNAPLEELNQIETVIAAAISAAATGFQVYSTIKASKDAAKAQKEAAASAAARSAAEFEQQFAMQMAAQGQVAMAPGTAVPGMPGAVYMAPLSAAAGGIPWNYILPIGAGVVVLGGIAILLLKR